MNRIPSPDEMRASFERGHEKVRRAEQGDNDFECDWLGWVTWFGGLALIAFIIWFGQTR